jgi:integrase
LTGKKDRNLKFVDGKWFLDFTHRGRRVRKFGGYTKDQAKVALAKERLDRRDIELGLKKSPADDVPFEKFADDYVTLYAKPNKRSWRQDELILPSLKKHFRGETLRSITPEKIQRFVAERKIEKSKNNGNTISPSTVNRALALLKTILGKAVEWGRIEMNPAARVKKLKEPPGRERFLTHEEAGRLLAAANPEFRTILIVALGTGMRRGEILALRWTDLDLVRGIITVSMSKSGRSRKIPMSSAVAVALGGVPRRGEFVFWNEETKTHLKDVKTAFRATCARAKKNPDDEKDPGITDVRFHDLRHTAFSWMDQEGVKITTIQKIAGHASIEMTRRYIHERSEDERAAVGILGGILDSTRQKECPPYATVTVPAVPSVRFINREN